VSEPVILTRPDGVLSVLKPDLPPPHRLLVMIHGWGQNENSLWELKDGLPQDYWIVAPRGSYFKAEGEYGWRPTIIGRRSRLEENLGPATELVARIDAWAGEIGVDASQFSVMGFSQGAALVYVLANLFPKRLTRAVVLSGYPPRGLDLSDTRLKDIPFLVSHGTRDDIIDIEEARRALPMLGEAGARVTWIEEDVAHTPGPITLQTISDFLK
jgi:phospholipase/carboxylesterase